MDTKELEKAKAEILRKAVAYLRDPPPHPLQVIARRLLAEKSSD